MNEFILVTKLNGGKLTIAIETIAFIEDFNAESGQETHIHFLDNCRVKFIVCTESAETIYDMITSKRK